MGKRLGLVKDVAVAFGAGMGANLIPFVAAGTVGRAIGNGARGDIDLEDSIRYGVKSGLVAGAVYGVLNVVLSADDIKRNYEIRKMEDEILEGEFQETGE